MLFSRFHLQHEKAFNYSVATKCVSDPDLTIGSGWPAKIQYKH